MSIHLCSTPILRRGIPLMSIISENTPWTYCKMNESVLTHDINYSDIREDYSETRFQETKHLSLLTPNQSPPHKSHQNKEGKGSSNRRMSRRVGKFGETRSENIRPGGVRSWPRLSVNEFQNVNSKYIRSSLFWILRSESLPHFYMNDSDSKVSFF